MQVLSSDPDGSAAPPSDVTHALLSSFVTAAGDGSAGRAFTDTINLGYAPFVAGGAPLVALSLAPDVALQERAWPGLPAAGVLLTPAGPSVLPIPGAPTASPAPAAAASGSDAPLILGLSQGVFAAVLISAILLFVSVAVLVPLYLRRRWVLRRVIARSIASAERARTEADALEAQVSEAVTKRDATEAAKKQEEAYHAAELAEAAVTQTDVDAVRQAAKNIRTAVSLDRHHKGRGSVRRAAKAAAAAASVAASIAPSGGSVASTVAPKSFGADAAAAVEFRSAEAVVVAAAARARVAERRARGHRTQHRHEDSSSQRS